MKFASTVIATLALTLAGGAFAEFKNSGTVKNSTKIDKAIVANVAAGANSKATLNAGIQMSGENSGTIKNSTKISKAIVANVAAGKGAQAELNLGVQGK
jgi:hypothetical protein